MITSAVLITIIVCVTILLMGLIGTINKAIERRDVKKSLEKFTKAFPELKKKKEDDDDLPKFGGF